MKIMTNRQLKEMEDRIQKEVYESIDRRQRITDMERAIHQDIAYLSQRITRLEEMANIPGACKVDSTPTIKE